MKLDQAHVLVTGASRGLGRRIAAAVAGEGARVTITARSKDELEMLRQEIGPPTMAVPADVADADQRESLLRQAEAEHGPVDVLVNNAGVEYASAYAVQAPEEILQTIEVNLTAPLLLTREVLAGMIERRRGHVVNVASLAGLSATPFEAAYSASKFGLVGFTQALRAELRGTGVGCSVVCPGFVAGEGMYARYAEQGISAPRLLVSSLDRVAAAVVGAVRRDRALTIVNPLPMRGGVSLQNMLPGIHAPVAERLGLTGLFRRAAEMRGSV